MIFIDWHRMKSREIHTRMVPRLASRCCLSVSSSLFLNLTFLLEFRFFGDSRVSAKAKIPFEGTSTSAAFTGEVGWP